MHSIKLDEFKKVPYLRVDDLNERVVGLKPFWDGKEWHLWININGVLQPIKPLNSFRGAYVAKEPAQEGDLYIPFVDLMWQRASYKDIAPLINAICGDFYNMSISLDKLRHIFETREEIKSRNVGGFVETEVEYILVLTRSVFDLLYEIIHCFWTKHTRLLDQDAEAARRSKTLPKKLSRFLLNDGTPRTAAELQGNFGIPEQLAFEFAKIGGFFASLRRTRDGITHHGSSLGTVYDTEKGFCVSPTERPFSEFYSAIDCAPYMYNSSIVSIMPWLTAVIFGTIDACNSLVHAFASIVQFPPEIAPGFRIFTRDPCGHALIDAHKIYTGGYPWWDSPDEQKKP